ncbi:MAG: hypothetical protein JWR08_1171 [Enterovirga sp.]|nr:hypothetical protein [Enterovirga sp.]
MDRSKNDSLKSFDAYRDENGQNMGQDAPTDLARPADLQRHLNSDPSWESETARVASGFARADSVEGGSVESSDQTAAETPPDNLARISDASIRPGEAGSREAVERATASLGKG